MFKVAPLSSTFMLGSMAGFILSAFFLTHPIFKSWAWAFMIAFITMFIASLVSMSQTPIGDEELLENLAIHKKSHYKKK